MKTISIQVILICLLVLAAVCLILFFTGCDSVTTAPTMKDVKLTWIAPGDDGFMGQAARYDCRYSTDSARLVNNFETCTSVLAFQNKVPAPGGAADSLTFSVSIETGTRYFFAIKTADEVPNWSLISNLWAVIWSDVDAPIRITDLSGQKL